jgi:GPI-anchor transamidase subunit K
MAGRLCTLAALCLLAAAAPHAASAPADGAHASGHTSNWAVLLSTSRYWFNYRHISDALTFYHICRRSGMAVSVMQGGDHPSVLHVRSFSTYCEYWLLLHCRLGIPDSNIILMLPDDIACNPRNPHPGQAGCLTARLLA